MAGKGKSEKTSQCIRSGLCPKSPLKLSCLTGAAGSPVANRELGLENVVDWFPVCHLLAMSRWQVLTLRVSFLDLKSELIIVPISEGCSENLMRPRIWSRALPEKAHGREHAPASAPRPPAQAGPAHCQGSSRRQEAGTL